jgi:AraC-like DNA-binding protein
MKLSMQNFFHLFGAAKRNQKNASPINFSPEKIRQVTIQMNDFMDDSLPYLQTKYSVRNLASDLNIAPHHLSMLLNREMGINFNDYLNRYRITYCKQLMRKGEADNLNLKGLSALCGFNNRNTFTTAFKKFTGHTPSDFARHFKELQEA